jgi:hypothetical protein
MDNVGILIAIAITNGILGYIAATLYDILKELRKK